MTRVLEADLLEEVDFADSFEHTVPPFIHNGRPEGWSHGAVRRTDRCRLFSSELR